MKKDIQRDIHRRWQATVTVTATSGEKGNEKWVFYLAILRVAFDKPWKQNECRLFELLLSNTLPRNRKTSAQLHADSRNHFIVFRTFQRSWWDLRAKFTLQLRKRNLFKLCTPANSLFVCISYTLYNGYGKYCPCPLFVFMYNFLLYRIRGRFQSGARQTIPLKSTIN